MDLFTFILIYFISLFLVLRYFKIAYSKEGIWSNLKWSDGDRFIVICPVLNTSAVFVFYLTGGPKRN